MLCAVSVHSGAVLKAAEQQLEERLSSEQTLSGEKMLATTLYFVFRFELSSTHAR